MIDILICEDNAALCNGIKEIIEMWSQKIGEEVRIGLCFSGKSLRNHLEYEQRPDLLFLDIKLGDENGVEIGDYIREQLKDETIQIVFISSYTQYAIDLFKLRPFDFLIKPVNYKAAEKVLLKYLEIKQRNEEQKYYFVFQNRKQVFRVEQSDILYFQSNGRKISIITDTPRKPALEYYGTLSDVVGQLDKTRFWNIHKSFLVNVEYVTNIGYNKFSLKNGEVIPVSRSRRRMFSIGFYNILIHMGTASKHTASPKAPHHPRITPVRRSPPKGWDTSLKFSVWPLQTRI